MNKFLVMALYRVLLQINSFMNSMAKQANSENVFYQNLIAKINEMKGNSNQKPQLQSLSSIVAGAQEAGNEKQLKSEAENRLDINKYIEEYLLWNLKGRVDELVFIGAALEKVFILAWRQMGSHLLTVWLSLTIMLVSLVLEKQKVAKFYFARWIELMGQQKILSEESQVFNGILGLTIRYFKQKKEDSLEQKYLSTLQEHCLKHSLPKQAREIAQRQILFYQRINRPEKASQYRSMMESCNLKMVAISAGSGQSRKWSQNVDDRIFDIYLLIYVCLVKGEVGYFCHEEFFLKQPNFIEETMLKNKKYRIIYTINEHATESMRPPFYNLFRQEQMYSPSYVFTQQCLPTEKEPLAAQQTQQQEEFVVNGDVKKLLKIIYQTYIICIDCNITIKDFLLYSTVRQLKQNLPQLVSISQFIIIIRNKQQLEQLIKDDEIMAKTKIVYYVIKKRGEEVVTLEDSQYRGKVRAILEIESIKNELDNSLSIPNFTIITGKDKSTINEFRFSFFWLLRKYKAEAAIKDFFQLIKQDVYALHWESSQKLKKIFQEIQRIARQNTKQRNNYFIKLYTENTFFYRLLNKCLRLAPRYPKLIAYIRFPFSQVYESIKEKFLKQLQGQDIELSRGCTMTEQQICELEKNVGGYLQMEGFLSTTLSDNRKLIKNFGETILRIKVPKISQKDKNDKDTPAFAFIEQISEVKGEFEVLFNPLNLFKIIKVLRCLNTRQTQIYLEYTLIRKVEVDHETHKKNLKSGNLSELEKLKLEQEIQTQNDLLINYYYQKQIQKIIKTQGDVFRELGQVKEMFQYYIRQFIHEMSKDEASSTNVREPILPIFSPEDEIIGEIVQKLDKATRQFQIKNGLYDQRSKSDKKKLLVSLLNTNPKFCLNALYNMSQSDFNHSRKFSKFAEAAVLLLKKCKICDRLKEIEIMLHLQISRKSEKNYETQIIEIEKKYLQQLMDEAENAKSKERKFEVFKVLKYFLYLYFNQDKKRVFEISQKCLSYFQKNLSDQVTNEYMQILHNLGGILFQHGNHKESLVHLQKEYSLLEKTKGYNHCETRKALLCIYSNKFHLQQYEEALQGELSIKELIALYDGKNGLGYLINLNNIGMAYNKLGRYEQALCQLKDTLELEKANLEQYSYEYAFTCTVIGQVYYNLKQLEQAETYFNSSREMLIEKKFDKTAEYANALFGLGQIYGLRGELLRAQKTYEECRQIRLKRLIKGNHNYYLVLSKLQQIEEYIKSCSF